MHQAVAAPTREMFLRLGNDQFAVERGTTAAEVVTDEPENAAQTGIFGRCGDSIDAALGACARITYGSKSAA